MAGRPASTPAPECGARLAALRKAAGLSQAQLGDAVGIPARSVSFYERKAQSIPSHLVPQFAKALGVTAEEVLGIDPVRSKSKRGPKSDLEKRFAQINELPRGQQKKILEAVDAMIAQQRAAGVSS